MFSGNFQVSKKVIYWLINIMHISLKHACAGTYKGINRNLFTLSSNPQLTRLRGL
jgi:hypothetical protein